MTRSPGKPFQRGSDHLMNSFEWLSDPQREINRRAAIRASVLSRKGRGMNEGGRPPKLIGKDGKPNQRGHDVLLLKKAGHSSREIAKVVEVSKTCVCRFLKTAASMT